MLTSAKVTGTLDELAKRWNVEKPIAYGFINFLKGKGLATAVPLPKEPGKKGKSANMITVPAVLNFDMLTGNSTNVTPLAAAPLSDASEDSEAKAA